MGRDRIGFKLWEINCSETLSYVKKMCYIDLIVGHMQVTQKLS